MSLCIKLQFSWCPPNCNPQTPTLNKTSPSSKVTLPSSQFIQKHNGLFTKWRNSQEPTTVNQTCQQPQIQPLIDLLRDIGEKGSSKELKALHSYTLKSNFRDNELLVLYNHVIHAYFKCSDLCSAHNLFYQMSHRKNVFSWTVMISGSTESGYFLDGVRFFCEMQMHGIAPDEFVYSAVTQSCIHMNYGELGRMVHAQIVVSGFSSHVVVSTSLLNMYAKIGNIKDSCKVFNTMIEHNQVSWNAMISGLTTNGLHLASFDLLGNMSKQGLSPNLYTLISVSKAVGKLGDLSKAKEVHNHACELGIESKVSMGTALIDMYSKCGALSDARLIFDQNFTNCGVNTPWNAMISGYSQYGFSKKAFKLYNKMHENDIKSDLYTYCSIFNAIADLKNLKHLKEVHGMVLKGGCDLAVLSVNNAIADAYSKCGSLEDVRNIFDRMEERDIVSWTTLLTAYSQCNEGEQALEVFYQMREEGFLPNEFTFSSVLVSCASLCLLEHGRQVHGLSFKSHLDTQKCVESALVDMYSKCGSIYEAEKVFNKILNPDVVSWTAIILGYALHGLVSNALNHFTNMEKMGIKPNAVTFLCILFACSHGGMVEEGLHFFQLMEIKYGLVPELEHYACVVDLLGRVGRLDDALEFIAHLPIEPNEIIWQTLLAACRVHGNVELGEVAANKIHSIKPEYSAPYVLLSNTYMAKGSLKDGLNVRTVMKDRGVKKEPGFSWISVRGRVHKFYSGDKKHPQMEDIYMKLKELREKIKAMGYKPDFRYVSQHVD